RHVRSRSRPCRPHGGPPVPAAGRATHPRHAHRTAGRLAALALPRGERVRRTGDAHAHHAAPRGRPARRRPGRTAPLQLRGRAAVSTVSVRGGLDVIRARPDELRAAAPLFTRLAAQVDEVAQACSATYWGLWTAASLGPGAP